MSDDKYSVAAMRAARNEITAKLEAARTTHDALLQAMLTTPANLLTNYQLHTRYQAEQTVKVLEAQLVELDEMEAG